MAGSPPGMPAYHARSKRQSPAPATRLGQAAVIEDCCEAPAVPSRGDETSCRRRDYAPGGPAAQGRFENAVGRPTNQQPARGRGGADPSRPRAGAALEAGGARGARGVDQLSAPAAPAPPPPAVGAGSFLVRWCIGMGPRHSLSFSIEPADRSQHSVQDKSLAQLDRRGTAPKGCSHITDTLLLRGDTASPQATRGKKRESSRRGAVRQEVQRAVDRPPIGQATATTRDAGGVGKAHGRNVHIRHFTFGATPV